jgi:serine/threonine protein phosphatase PrpC
MLALDADSAAQRLVEAALNNGGRDNISLVIVKVADLVTGVS